MKTYTFHISLFDLALLAVLFLGMGVAGLLWFAGRSRRAQNRFLAMAMMVVVLFIACVLAAHLKFAPYLLQPLLVFGPFLFFYVCRLTKPGSEFTVKDVLHFVPIALSSVSMIAFWLVPVSILVYLYAAHKQIANHYHRMAFNNGDRYRQELRWLQWLLGALGLVTIMFLAFSTADHFFYQYQLLVDRYYHYPFELLLGILMIWLSCTAFLRTVDPPQAAASFLKPRQPNGIREKGIWLKRTLKLNRYYLDPELSLRSLADKLGVHPNELSRIINNVLKKSFNDLVNEYRIIDVCRKMQNPAYDHLTLLGIAFESGFNSKTTFNRTFKEMTGKSPAEYKNELKKVRPNYNMGRPVGFADLLSYQIAVPIWAGMKAKRNVMFKNYFKIAWRNLMRNGSYTSINIAGLAIGIAACILIFLIVRYEISFDNYHPNKERIYRVVRVTGGPEGIHTGVGTPIPLTQGLKIDFPQLKQVSDIMQNGGSHYTVANTQHNGTLKKFKEDLAYYADPEFFRIFDFKWLAGDKKTALAALNTIVLSREEANKFFGDWRTALGKTVKYENNLDMQVTGIFEDTPANTDIPIKLAVSWATLVREGGALHGSVTDWVSTFGAKNCYIVLPDGLSEQHLNKDLAAFAKRHTPAQYNKDAIYRLQPLKDIHFNTETSVYSGHTFSKQLINVISLIGLFLLVIACVNFINLATAQAVNRSKEVGVRKVLGSNRSQLVFQFISETFIITLFSVMLAAVISIIMLPTLNDLLETHLSGALMVSNEVILFLAVLVIAVTLLAGLYPALVLSGFNPITALRNKVNAGRASGISLRRVLVVVQFCIAQFLVIGTLTLIYQMNYFKDKSLGFDKDAVINVSFPADSAGRAKVNTLINEIGMQSGVKDISMSTFSPSDDGDWFSDFKFDNSPKPVDFSSSLKWADPGFFKLYKIEFIAGGPYLKTDTVTGYVINETLMHKLGITDARQALGKTIMLWDRKTLYAPITGVVKDFNVGSLRNAIPPVLMGSFKKQYSKLNIKIGPHNVKQTLAGIENSWNKTYPEGIYEYRFLDQAIANFYKKENELSTLYKIFAGIAIFISCLGLYGLVSFMAVQRTKEVGIRKTLGASIGNIVYLFSKEFTILILFAFVLSAPVGYYLMNKWLQDYAYRITIGPGIFIWAILASVTIAWASVGVKAFKAALANPVKSLKSE